MILDRALDPIVRWFRRRERSYVYEPALARRLVVADVLLFVLALVALFARSLLVHHYWLWFGLSTMVGLLVGLGAFALVHRALAYRSGWLDGRAAMADSLEEAQRRGWSIDEWMRLERVRDFSIVLGPPPDSLDDD